MNRAAAASQACLDQMMSLLADVVNVDSGSQDVDGVRSVQSRFAREYASLGFDIRYLDGASYAPTLCAEYGPQDRAVVLLGHADTVFPAGTSRARPFLVDKTMRRAYGPGVFDMKAGLVVLLFAVRHVLTQSGGRLPFGLRILINGDEEPGSPESRKHFGSCMDGALCAFVLEPPDDGGQLVVSRKGVGVFRLKSKGRAAHAGDGQRAGGNAVHALLNVLSRVLQLAGEDAGTSVNIGAIRGGSNPSIIPARASAEIDVRVVSCEEAGRFERGAREASRSTSVAGTRVTFEGCFHRPPMEPLPRTRPLQQVLAAVGESLGVPVSFNEEPRGGASDGNLVTSLDVPCIDGMGVLGGGAHTDAEWIDVASMVDRTDLLAGVLMRLLEQEAPQAEFRG